MFSIEYVYRVLEYSFLFYFFLYNSINFCFIFLSFFEVRRKVISRGFEDLDVVMMSPFTPPISLIVPAYNEESTIVESVNSMLNLKFPRVELVIVNDGSTDTTLDVLKTAFNLKRVDINYIETITTAPILGYYESRQDLPEHVLRFVLVNKENGSKADALNAGINASLCPYFLSIDADSVIDELALLQAFRTLLNNEGIVAIGGQVAILNGSVIKKGKVVQPKLSNCWLVRFQIVEYLRSFTLGRTALSRLNSLFIISGVFGIFQKEFVKKIGGYLTKDLTSKIASEYAGSMAETVCEDMEIIVRMQRYIQDKKLNKRIAYVPHPLCWTEAPENLDSLSKQRNRWQRGFLETMVYHRKMLFNRDYGRIGFFAFPYFLCFELLGGPIEFFGYVTLPLLFLFHSLNYSYLIMFILVSIIYGVLISVSSIVVGAWPAKTTEADTSKKSLIYFSNTREIFILLAFAVLENFGYRQLTLWWRIKGTVDFIRGKKRWEKFQRIGFGENS